MRGQGGDRDGAGSAQRAVWLARLVSKLDRQESLYNSLTEADDWQGVQQWRSALKRLFRQPIKDMRLRILRQRYGRSRFRILRETYGRSRNRASHEVSATLFTGQTLRVSVPELVGDELYRYGFWEAGPTRVVMTYLGPGMVFADVGAQFGYFALLAHYLVGPQGQVFAFEPTEHTFQLLKKNIGRLAGCRAEKFAVFSSSGVRKMQDFGPQFSAWNTLRRQPNIPDWVLPYFEAQLRPREVEVPAITLDDYFGRQGVRPDFVKIDAEAADYEVLLGMANLLREGIGMVMIETGDHDIPGAATTAESIAYLRGLGYQCFEQTNGDLRLHASREKYVLGNLFFKRP